MKAASRLADFLLKDLSRFDTPQLNSEGAELADFAATYLWYGCRGGESVTSQDGIGSDLSEKDSVLFNCCCQYLELLVLGQKKTSDVPKHLSVILKSFRKPLTAARWKIVTARIQKVLQSIISSIEATPTAESVRRLSLACCLTESVVVFVSFLVSFQNSEAAKRTVHNFMSSLESCTLKATIGRSDFDALKLVASMLLTFTKSTGSTKSSKELSSLSAEVVEQCLSSLNSALQEFTPSFSEIHAATAGVLVTSVESLIAPLVGKKDGDVLSAESLQAAVSLYACQLELCEAVLLHHSRVPSESDGTSQILCLKRDIWFRKFHLINTHLQKEGSGISGTSFFTAILIFKTYLLVECFLVVNYFDFRVKFD